MRLLGVALSSALARDFSASELHAAASDPAAELPISARELSEVAQAHLEALLLYHCEITEALANASRDGEEARRAERQRIWGFS